MVKTFYLMPYRYPKLGVLKNSSKEPQSETQYLIHQKPFLYHTSSAWVEKKLKWKWSSVGRRGRCPKKLSIRKRGLSKYFYPISNFD